MSFLGRRLLGLAIMAAGPLAACGGGTTADPAATLPTGPASTTADTPSTTTGEGSVSTATVASSAPATSDPPPTTATTTATTTVPVGAAAPLVAITADGDAIFFQPGSSSPTLLFDGPDPDGPPPAEGPGPNVVDAVAVTPDGMRAYVGLCCEPIAGAILTATPPDVASYETSTPPNFGYGPAVSPDGRFVAVGEINGPVVSIFDIATGEQLPVPPLEVALDVYSPYDTMWIDAHRLVALGVVSGDGPAAGWRAHAVTISRGDVNVADAIDLSTIAGDGTDTLLRLAGIVDRDHFAVHREGESSAAVVSFDSGAIDDAVAVAVDVGEPARSIWIRPGDDTIYVGLDDRLHIGDEVVVGAFRWARR